MALSQFFFIQQDYEEVEVVAIISCSDSRLDSSILIVGVESHSVCSPLPWGSLDFKTITN